MILPANRLLIVVGSGELLAAEGLLSFLNSATSKIPTLNKAINNRARRSMAEMPVAHPPVENWALALVADLRVCCAAILILAEKLAVAKLREY